MKKYLLPLLFVPLSASATADLNLTPSSDSVVELIYTQGQKLIEPTTGLSVQKLFHDTLFNTKARMPCIDFVRLHPNITCTNADKKSICKVTISIDQFIAIELDKKTKDQRTGLKVSVLGSPEALALDDFMSYDLTIETQQDKTLRLTEVSNFTSAGGGTEYGESCSTN